ncbi:MAG: TonB-dependent siderophore receptor [Ferruginibacter sp.]
MKQLFAVLVFLFAAFASDAQNKGTVKGRIVSIDNQPLENISIQLTNTKLGTVSNEEGLFFISNITPGTYTLTATGIGLKGERQNIIIEAGKSVELSLQLSDVTTELKDVIVTGYQQRQYVKLNSGLATRSNTPLRDIPQAVQIIPKQILVEQQVYRLSDVYKNVAGVTEQSDYNYVNMRGFLTSSDNFMLNGQRNSYFGLATSPQIPYAEKVEVLKGASSVLYGNGAIGGTINIVTKKPKKEFSTGANITFGSFNLTRLQADVTGALNKSKSLSGLLNIGIENGGSFYKDFKNKSITLTPVLVWNIGTHTELTSTTIFQSGKQTASVSGIPVIGTNNLFAVPENFRYAANDSKFQTTSIQEQLNLKHDFNEKLTGNIWLSYAAKKTEANIYQPGGFSPRVDSITRLKAIYNGKLRGYGINAYLNYKTNTGKIEHAFVVGFDYNNAAEYYPKGENYWYAPAISLNNPNYSTFNTTGITPDYYGADKENYGPSRSVGVYLQDQITFSEKLKALLALRYDDYLNRSYFLIGGTEYYDSSKANAVVPKIGLVYQPTKTISLYGSYSEAFQPQYSNSRAAGGPFPPLRAKQFETGVKGEFFKKRLATTVTWYQIKEVNVLKPDPTDATGVRQLTAGEVTSRGLELTLTGMITTGWNVLANYSRNKIFISKSNVAGEKGTGFGDTPNDAFSIWTTYQFQQLIKGLKVGMGYRNISERNVYGLVLPAYDVLDALVSYQYKKYGIAVNGFNLANKRYALGSFGTSYYFPGAPRSVQVSINYNW